MTLVGVLVTFAPARPAAGLLTDIDEGERPTAARSRLSGSCSARAARRGVVDFALISASFTIAYLLFVDGSGTDYQKHIFLVSLPAILAARYLCFITALYSGVWRFAGAREAAIIVAVIVSEGLAYGIVWFTSRPFGDFPQRIYVLDALIDVVLVGSSRFAERVLFRACDVPRPARAAATLLVGAGRSGQEPARASRDAGRARRGLRGRRPRLRGRRMQGVPVLGTLPEIDRVLASRSRPRARDDPGRAARRPRRGGASAASRRKYPADSCAGTRLDPLVALGAAVE